MKFTITTERLILRVLSPEFTQDVVDFYNENRGEFEKYEASIIDDYYSYDHHKKVL